MENKKLIKEIKKKVVKQFKLDLKRTVLKELFGDASKKEIKKLRKQILADVQAEIFGDKKFTEIENQEVESIVSEFEISDEIKEVPEVSEEIKETEKNKILEYRGFKFDVDRMSALVTGIKKKKNKSKKIVDKIDANQESKNLPNEIVSILGENNLKDGSKSILEKINDIRNGVGKSDTMKHVKAQTPGTFYSPHTSIPIQGFNMSPYIPGGLSSMNMVPSTRDYVKTEIEKLTPSRKEEIAFFVGKLKDGVDSLGRGEKNILYRKKKDNVYTFSFEKQKLDKNDFSLNFELDLNMYTYGAKINTFSFNIDGFNFDKGFVEILDIIAVFDAVGMNLSKYIDEISEMNYSATETKESIKNNIKENSKLIKSNAELANIIFDKKIMKVLRSNDINTYGQLKRIEDLTSLKGVGVKTAEKIEKYIK